MNELYIAAREVLLDALQVLRPHRNSLVLVGAQAIYLRLGASVLAVASHTTDADLAFDPTALKDAPPLEKLLMDAGFEPSKKNPVGVWQIRHLGAHGHAVLVDVDLLAPTTMSPGIGRRAARLTGHEPKAVRMVDGMEGVLVDRDWLDVPSLLKGENQRQTQVLVAGHAALLMMKLHKISERAGTHRLNNKDALDVFRILQETPVEVIVERFDRVLKDERTSAPARKSLQLLEKLFGTRASTGAIMAADAAGPLMESAQLRRSVAALTQQLLSHLSYRSNMP